MIWDAYDKSTKYYSLKRYCIHDDIAKKEMEIINAFAKEDVWKKKKTKWNNTYKLNWR